MVYLFEVKISQIIDDVNERKFQKALQVVERIAAMGVTTQKNSLL